jgi:hypothetical protein
MDSDLRRKPRRRCFRLPPGLSIFYIIIFLCILIGLTSLASIYSQTPVLFSSVLKSTLFTPNSSPQSSLSIPDLSSLFEIRTFRCYKGTAHKLRPSPFRSYLRSLEIIILLPEPNMYFSCSVFFFAAARTLSADESLMVLRFFL